VRYARHLSLAELGVEGQRALRSSRVLIVGTGGLGSPAALYLAAAGVGTLGIVDDDRVDVTNLQRQIVHGTSTIGQPKVHSAARRLADLNPHVEVVAYEQRLDRSNALEVLEGWDLVIDGSDNFPTRYLVNDAALLSGIPFVYGAILRWEGQVSLFGAQDGPCYRCLFREPPPPDLVPSCADAGVVGALAGVIGSMQALEAVRYLTGVGRSLAGRLKLFDGLDMSWREVELRRDPACPLCGDDPSITELIDYEWFCGLRPGPAAEGLEAEGVAEPAAGPQGGGAAAAAVDALWLAAALEGPEAPVIVDVREHWEWQAGNLSSLGARHIPLGELRDRLTELPRGRRVVTVCSVGARSAAAAALLRRSGFDDAANLDDGLQAWVRVVDPDFTLI
jgi:adenylyltransferase/sulfurtransferase